MPLSAPMPTVAVLGASGLIGQVVAKMLQAEGFRVVPIARRFTAAQKPAFGDAAIEAAVVDLEPDRLARLLSRDGADIVVNCVGILQDSSRRGRAKDVHCGFIARLVEAISVLERPCLLVHLSIPGRSEEDHTAFSTTKRAAERIIAAATLPFVILRPGFVIAPAAYGGSALIRALAALPFDLAKSELSRPFAVTDVADIARTIAAVGRRWCDGERGWNAVWDVMERRASTVGEVVAAFRRHLGGPRRRLRLPSWSMSLAARAGDLVSHLGWSPPIRSTALAEMRRGVDGNPEPWIAATGLEPASLDESMSRLPVTVQDRWFARLFLLKPVILGTLVVFWMLTGLIALTLAFDAAKAILMAHGFSLWFAQAITVASSLADIVIGGAIAMHRTCRAGLAVGIGLSVIYMAGAAFLMPGMWIEPFGALVKTVPAILLMLVALAIIEVR